MSGGTLERKLSACSDLFFIHRADHAGEAGSSPKAEAGDGLQQEV